MEYQQLYPANAEQAFVEKLSSMLSKADPQASDKSLCTFGTLGVLRHELVYSPWTITEPDSDTLDPDTNTLPPGESASQGRRGEEREPSPAATTSAPPASGRVLSAVAKAWRIDLVLFVNGIPVVTMEL